MFLKVNNHFCNWAYRTRALFDLNVIKTYFFQRERNRSGGFLCTIWIKLVGQKVCANQIWYYFHTFVFSVLPSHHFMLNNGKVVVNKYPSLWYFHILVRHIIPWTSVHITPICGSQYSVPRLFAVLLRLIFPTSVNKVLS